MKSNGIAILIMMFASTSSPGQSSPSSAPSNYDRPKNPVQEWVLACRKASVLPAVGNKFQCWGAPAQRLIDWVKTMEPPMMLQGIPFYARGTQGYCYLWQDPKKPNAPKLASCAFGASILPKQPTNTKSK